MMSNKGKLISIGQIIILFMITILSLLLLFIFFPFRGYGHYNAKGYNYITDVIMNRINDK